jgi:hypothetical protein
VRSLSADIWWPDCIESDDTASLALLRRHSLPCFIAASTIPAGELERRSLAPVPALFRAGDEKGDGTREGEGEVETNVDEDGR